MKTCEDWKQKKRADSMVSIVRGGSMEGRECFRNPLKSETVWINEGEKGEFKASGENTFIFGKLWRVGQQIIYSTSAF